MDTPCFQIGFNDQLLLYLDRSLSACKHADIAEHLRECPRCAREHGMLNSILMQLSFDRDLLRTAEGFGACIPPAELVALAEGKRFSEELICAFKRHMHGCKSCRDEFDMLKGL